MKNLLLLIDVLFYVLTPTDAFTVTHTTIHNENTIEINNQEYNMISVNKRTIQVSFYSPKL